MCCLPSQVDKFIFKIPKRGTKLQLAPRGPEITLQYKLSKAHAKIDVSINFTHSCIALFEISQVSSKQEQKLTLFQYYVKSIIFFSIV